MRFSGIELGWGVSVSEERGLCADAGTMRGMENILDWIIGLGFMHRVVDGSGIKAGRVGVQ